MANLRQRLSKLPPRPEVKVKVLNGSGVTGIAGQTATALTGRGFDVVGTGPATGASGADDYSYRNSVIEYASAAELPYVNTLRKQLSPVTVQHDASVNLGTIELILGSSFTALAPQPTYTLKPPARQPVPRFTHTAMAASLAMPRAEATPARSPRLTPAAAEIQPWLSPQ